MTPDGFCRGYYMVIADALVRCYGVELPGAQELLVNSVLCQRFDASVAAHRSSFDGTHAAACLNELSGAVTCDTSTTGDSSAEDCAFFAPLVPVGGTCKSFGVLIPQECMGTSYCKRGPNEACEGTCTEAATVNQPCDPGNDVRCGPKLLCDSTSKTCVAIGAPGPTGAACDELRPCAKGLYCGAAADAGSGAPGTCQPRKTSGPCTGTSECVTPARCAGAPGAATCATPKRPGDPCTPGWGECDLASHCDADHKCSDTFATLGQPCGVLPGTETVACGDGLYCDGPIRGAGTCRALKQPGDACTGMTLLECDGNAGRCDATTHQCVDCPF
jgi:hypothetical protein